MIVLDKKKIVFVLSCFTFSIFTFYFLIGKENNNVLQTTSLPASDKVIILDAGHGSPDERILWLTLI